MKKNLKNKIVKFIAGMMLACSLLAVVGSVSSDGVMPCAEVIIADNIVD